MFRKGKRNVTSGPISSIFLFLPFFTIIIYYYCNFQPFSPVQLLNGIKTVSKKPKGTRLIINAMRDFTKKIDPIEIFSHPAGAQDQITI